MVLISERVGSAFTTPRPCLVCGSSFLVPRTTTRRLTDYCSFECERRAGISRSGGFYRTPTPPPDGPVGRPVLTIVKRARVVKPDSARSKFASNLITLRKRRGWTQIDLARELGTRVRNAVGLWECDKVSPSVDTLCRLANVFEVTMDDLWRGTV